MITVAATATVTPVPAACATFGGLLTAAGLAALRGASSTGARSGGGNFGESARGGTTSITGDAAFGEPVSGGVDSIIISIVAWRYIGRL